MKLREKNSHSQATVQTFSSRVMLAVGLMLTAVLLSKAQSFVTVDKNLEVLGVPPVPVSLVAEVAPYTQMYGLPLAGWDPAKREIWLKGLSSATWISKVKEPGASPENLDDLHSVAWYL